MKVTAVFDIGKTNKKCFLFDRNYREVYKTYAHFEEVPDLEGFPSDPLPAISDWVLQTFQELRQTGDFDIKAVNFSTYGASFVHLDDKGTPLMPLINYLKPYPEKILAGFYKKYGPPEDFALETASPALAMLNSGLQLYWLKYAHPEIFEQIRWSLHLPQYFSYLFTKLPVSEYTSIGCHTGLWDFSKNDYHEWVYAEGIDEILPPIVPTHTSVNIHHEGKPLAVGVGIHDSSGALLPYLRADQKPFLLLSTGTWSIALNPFNQENLTPSDLQQDCLNFLRIDGLPVKAARLFLGHEYSLQIADLQKWFQVTDDAHKDVTFDEAIFKQVSTIPERQFRIHTLPSPADNPPATQYELFASFEIAYHRLLIELIDLQVQALELAKGGTAVKKIYLDGGFADNDIFIKLLSHAFPTFKLRTTQSPLGSALGAAMVMDGKELDRKFLKKQYAMKKHRPLKSTLSNDPPS